jgi:hypothetical protein
MGLRSSALRTDASVPVRASVTSTSTRPATRTRRARRTRRRRLVLGLQAQPEQARLVERAPLDLLSLRRDAGGLRQHVVPLARPGHVRRGRGRHAARAAERARLGLGLRRHAGLLRPVEPAGPLARRGPRPIRDDRLGGRRLRQERRRQRDHGHGGFRRGSERERTPGSEEPAPIPGQAVALLLHRAAWGQPHVRGRPGSLKRSAPHQGEGPASRGPRFFSSPGRRRGRVRLPGLSIDQAPTSGRA